MLPSCVRLRRRAFEPPHHVGPSARSGSFSLTTDKISAIGCFLGLRRRLVALRPPRPLRRPPMSKVGVVVQRRPRWLWAATPTPYVQGSGGRAASTTLVMGESLAWPSVSPDLTSMSISLLEAMSGCVCLSSLGALRGDSRGHLKSM
jgi:hypothetical protein